MARRPLLHRAVRSMELPVRSIELRGEMEELPSTTSSKKWIERNIKLPNDESTYAYGDLQFHAVNKKAKYVRAANDTDEEKLYHLLINEWKLPVPPIVISVTGGAENFEMKPRLTKEFQKSLVKAAESTGAWIVTGGTHAGVTKHVGNAIHNHHSTAKSRKVVALGIGTWGIVKDRERLIKKNQTAIYKCSGSQSLDHYHTHFILVDDGTVGEFGKEIELRTKLERYISQKHDAQVVCLLVQGGHNSLKTVYNALTCETPVVVLGGSGGWANILAYLYNENFNSISEVLVAQLMEDNGCNTDDHALLSVLANTVRECVKLKKLITVFSQDYRDGIKDLDHAILRAALKSKPFNDEQTKNHLKLALAWNRADIARTDIIDDCRSVDDAALTDIFLDAIKQDKPNFVELVLEHGLTLSSTFTEHHLLKLYELELLEQLATIREQLEQLETIRHNREQLANILEHNKLATVGLHDLLDQPAAIRDLREQLATVREQRKQLDQLVTIREQREQLATIREQREQLDQHVTIREQREELATIREQLKQLDQLVTIHEQREELATIREQREQLDQLVTIREQREELATIREQRKQLATIREQLEQLDQLVTIREQLEQLDQLVTIREQREQLDQLVTIREQREQLATIRVQREQLDQLVTIRVQREQLDQLVTIREQREQLATIREQREQREQLDQLVTIREQREQLATIREQLEQLATIREQHELREQLAAIKKDCLGPLYKSKFASGIEDFNKEETQAPLRELFFFCIYSQRKACARFLWNAMTKKSMLPAALVAVRILKVLSKKDRFRNDKDDILQHGEEYKKLSYGILTEYFDKDPRNTMLSLRHRMKPWGGLTCLQIAVDTKDIELLCHPAVQYFLDQIWFGGIEEPPSVFRSILLSLSIYLSYIVVFFIPLLWRETFSGTGFDLRDRTLLEKIKCFYGAPIVKFHATILFHLLFLLLFGYILLFNLFPTINVFEWILLGWVVTVVAEEARQMYDFPVPDILGKIELWWKDLGNKLDVISFVFYFIGFGLRFSIYLDAARVLLCLSFIVFSLRLLSMFTVSKELGPKLLIVQQMMKDLFFFIFILLVFLIAYGVASQSLLYPNETNVGTVFSGILSIPYWNIFGELFLPEIIYNPTADEFACTDNRTLMAQGHRRCPSGNLVVPVISALYLLMANVLLLNLLIAMFSYTFDKLVDKTDKIWKVQRFSLVEKYYRRPSLVVPFSFIPFFYELCHGKRPKFYRINVDVEFEELFVLWERNWVEEVLDELSQLEKNSLPFKVQRIDDRLETLTNVISRLQSPVDDQESQQNNFDHQLTINKNRIRDLETKLNDSNQSLQWIISALMQKQFVPTSVPGQVHENARSSPYPKSNVARFALQDHMVPWNVPLPDYKPPAHTDEKVLGGPVWADAESNYATLPYNQFDKKKNVNRASYEGRYQVIDGLPRNPCGRTGLAGRGLLGLFGPNHAADPIVTRWERDESGAIRTIGGKQVLQFVAIKRRDTSKWAIPGGMVEPGENISSTLRREFNEEVNSLENNLTAEEAKEIKERMDGFLLLNGMEVFRGYCDDHRNTDNAWIETVAYNFHDEEGKIFESIQLSAGDESVVKVGLQWKRIDSQLQLYADHRNYIEKVAKIHDAHF